MTAGPNAIAGRHSDAVDAEFVTVGAAAGPARISAVNPATAGPANLATTPHAGDGLALFGPAPPAAGAGSPSPVAFWGGGALLMAAAFWFAGGYALVDRAPAARPAAAAAALVISGVESRVEANNGAPVLFVEATVSNPTGSARQVPDLAVSIAQDGKPDPDRYVMHHKEMLTPGATVTFSLRLAAPPGGVKAVGVAFLR